MGLRQALARADGLGLDILYPTGLKCAGCGQLSHGELLCPDCANALEEDQLKGRLCPRCGQPLAPGVPCPMCLDANGEASLWARSVWPHSGVARRLVHQLKLNGRREAAWALSTYLVNLLRETVDSSALVTYVTTPPDRLKERPFDHAAELAQAVAASAGLPCRRTLERVHTEGLSHQLGLGRRERLRNLKGSFRCGETLSGTVVLVDDVLTTGSTARVATAALTAAGAERVLVLTATRALPSLDSDLK